METKEHKINTLLFTNEREYRLDEGIYLGGDFHVWDVSNDKNYNNFIHSPRKMVVKEIHSTRFSLIEWEDTPNQLALFSGARYITRANQFDGIVNSEFTMKKYNYGRFNG